MILTYRFCSLINKKLIKIYVSNMKCTNVAVSNNVTHFSTKPQKIVPLAVKLKDFRFLSQLSNESVCWNCTTPLKKLNHFTCDACGKLQDVNKEQNYFDLLSMPRNFDIHSGKLTKSFRKLQTLVHPDKFVNKPERERANSAEWSTLINKAYKTLSQPLLRGQYLLKLYGELMPDDNSTLNKKLLLEIMEKNEEVEDAKTSEDLYTLNNNLNGEIRLEIERLRTFFISNDLKNAKNTLVKMKYLLSIQKSIQAKLEKF